MSFPIDTQNCQQLIGTHYLYKVRVLNLETIMDADCGCDCFDLSISEVLQDQHWVSWICYIHRAGNIYCQDRIYHLIKSKHSLENVMRLITENCSLVDNSYQHVW